MTGEQPKSDWLTLRACAEDVGVPVELVRKWCVRYENGLAGGLASSNFSEKPDEDADRKNRRIKRETWEAFKKSRDREGRHLLNDEVSVAKRALVETISRYPSQKALRAAIAAERGR